MDKVVSAWKRYLARQESIQWQRDFFDHRLRSRESLNQKSEYILQNPVRAGLVQTLGNGHTFGEVSGTGKTARSATAPYLGRPGSCRAGAIMNRAQQPSRVVFSFLLVAVKRC